MERRFNDRVPIEVGVSCRVPASPERAFLLDLSRTGCRLEFGRHNIDLGATVSLDFRTGDPVGGQVVWTDGAQAGIRFHSALTLPLAIELGLEQREPRPDAEPELASEVDAPVEGLIQHWMRRLSGAFVG